MHVRRDHFASVIGLHEVHKGLAVIIQYMIKGDQTIFFLKFESIHAEKTCADTKRQKNIRVCHALFYPLSPFMKGTMRLLAERSQGHTNVYIIWILKRDSKWGGISDAALKSNLTFLGLI